MRTKNGSKKRVVFNNTYNDQLFEDSKRALAEELGIPEKDVCTERIWEEYYFIQDDNYNNTAVDLQMIEIDVWNDCLLVGMIGTWRGKAAGGKSVLVRELLTSMTNCDEVEVYGENKRIYVVGHHHDGVHEMELRVRRDGISDETWESICSGDFSRVENVTKSAYPYFQKYYGW